MAHVVLIRRVQDRSYSSAVAHATEFFINDWTARCQNVPTGIAADSHPVAKYCLICQFYSEEYISVSWLPSVVV